MRLNPIDKAWYSARLLLNQGKMLTPVGGGNEKPFAIQAGETVNSVAFRLEENHLIQDAAVFRLYMIYAGKDQTMQAGNYSLSPAMQPLEIADLIQNPISQEVTFVILAGWRSEEIANLLPTSGLSITPGEFLRFIESPEDLNLPDGLVAANGMEGYLAPGEYLLQRDISVKDLVQTFLDRFAGELTQDIRAGFERQGLTLTEAVTLASIVEKEGVVDDEHPLIASVFYNRLQAGMKLDSDPTVQYALGYNANKQTWWTNPLSLDDLQTDSPFNTYLYAGLPPHPISNPGLSALQAVAYPAQSPYYYFRARCDGSGTHAFAKTYEEHVQNACP
ncbi:MAG TPA: endolytic transglycosylase MltG [Longilinea sp.]|nr:endolytic transglycosylase MltG [Longilinea sp.]